MPDINFNLTDLVMHNLNMLLGDWIENYLFDNEECTNKIQVFLDTMLRKLEANDSRLSCSTYVVDIKIRGTNSKTTILSINVKRKPVPEVMTRCKTFSNITFPQTEKDFSIIPMLTIPRYVHTCQHQMTGKMLHKSMSTVKRKYNKKILLTISNSSRLVSSSSSLEMFEISTKSLTKHYATCHDASTGKKNGKKRRIIFIPSSYYKFPGSRSVTNLNEELASSDLLDIDPMPSLVKTIFTDEISSMENNNGVETLCDNSTMTDKYACDAALQLLNEQGTNVSPQVTTHILVGNEDLCTQLSGVQLKMEPNNMEMATNPESPCTCCNDKNTNTCRPCFAISHETSEPKITEDERVSSRCSVRVAVDLKDKKELYEKKPDDKEIRKIDDCSPKDTDDSPPPCAPCATKCGLLKKMFATKLRKCAFKDCDEKGHSNFTETFEKIRNKHFSYVYKKTDNKKNNEFLEHIQEMFKYFANYKGKRNINLDIRVKVYPTLEDDEEPERKNEQLCSGCDTPRRRSIDCQLAKVTVKLSTEQ